MRLRISSGFHLEKVELTRGNKGSLDIHIKSSGPYYQVHSNSILAVSLALMLLSTRVRGMVEYEVRFTGFATGDSGF